MPIGGLARAHGKAFTALPVFPMRAFHHGAIVYNKAPSVLKQLEFLAGDDAFRRGLQLFLKRHAFGNATWRDLLAAISVSGPIDRLGRGSAAPVCPQGDAEVLGLLACAQLHERCRREILRAQVAHVRLAIA